MKGRSQQCRTPAPMPATATDDWMDGSWTVDCSCGVTFDDGEEMVSCDECGVWVHTRCARFVRGRDASFVCHNCKAVSRHLRSADDQLVEESEVAQLLLDMPNQAENPPPLPCPPGGGRGQPPPRRPTFWTEIPLKDRVHVQGIPGGDPVLFGNLSSVFSCQIWRCTGYVPKKFSFHYKEFPCWDDDEEDRRNGEDEKTEDGDYSTANRGADMLFSLSNVISPPYAASVMKHNVFRGEGGVQGDKVSLGTNNMKETNKIRGKHSFKRKRDGTKEGKERSCSKKRPRSYADNAMSDSQKRDSSLLGSTKSSEVPKNANSQAKDSGSLNVKAEHQKDDKLAFSNSATTEKDGRHNNDGSKSLVHNENKVSVKEKDTKETCIKSENVVQTENPGIFPAVDAVIQGEEIDLADDSNLDESNFIVDTKGPCHSVPKDNLGPPSDLMDRDITMQENHMLPDSQDAIPTHFKLDNTENKIGQQVDQSRDYLKFPGYPISNDRKMNSPDTEPVHETSCQLSDIRKDFHDLTYLPSHGIKCQEAKKESNVRFNDRSGFERKSIAWTSKAEELVAESLIEKDSEPREKFSSNCSDEPILESQGQKKLPSGVARLEQGAAKISSAYLPVISKSTISVTALGTSSSSNFAKASILTKEQDKVTLCTSPKKECLETTLCTEGTIQETPKEPEKCYSKGCLNSRSTSSQISDLSASKHVIGSAKEPIPSALPRASTKEDATAHLGSIDASGASQSSATAVYGKTVSTKCRKNEKNYHSVPYSTTSKSLHSSMPLHTSQSVNTFTTLSDEELALLLHQELNSSPRVPRVPRMRQAAGMQSATTSSMSALSRRSSVSSEKVQSLVFRRKSKDDRWRRHSHNHHDSDDVSKRKHKVPSPDHQYHESSSMKKDTKNRSSGNSLLKKKNNSVTSTESTSSAPSSSGASGRSSLPFSSSPKVANEDVSQTPGVIDEIMSKDRHTTYEELCHAIHLTNASKKRRKVESNEPENRMAKTGAKKFPKGKRNARRCRLEQGRGIESRTKRIEDVASDEDQTVLSQSSRGRSEIFSNDDDSQDARPDEEETEISGSSSDESH